MKKTSMFRSSIICLLALAGMDGRIARADDPLPIAILNMDRVLKTHPPLLAELKPLQDEEKAVQEKVQLRQAELETVAARMQKTQPGSPEFQRLQMQAVKLQTELREFAATQQQTLQKRVLTVLVGFHRTLDEEVAKYAKAKGLKLVLRHQDSPLDENQPQAEILKSLNRSILYQDGLDITDDILKALEARAASTK
jgi:Skp family chaperone for outer membrane proteins